MEHSVEKDRSSGDNVVYLQHVLSTSKDGCPLLLELQKRPDMNWQKCIVCQEDKSEQLRAPKNRSRKKGLLSANDKKLRVTWAKENIGKSLTYWQDDVAFYLDGVGLAHKSNPAGEARAVSSMIWRRHDEGLKVTTKGRKEGSGGKVAKFFVAISHNKGVVMCYHHEWTVTGKNFFKLIREEFPKAFDKCGAGENNCTFLMDGCPKQNAALCRNTWESKNYRL
eukprot:gene19367-21287_t